MPAHSFDSILKEVSEKMNLSGLKATVNDNITLQVPPNQTLVTLQKHNKQPILIISSDIMELQDGRFRENIFREALKFNGLNEYHKGTFGFSKKSQKLILFDMLPLDEIFPEQVVETMSEIAIKVSRWKESLERGDIPTIDLNAGGSASRGGIFGIKS
jgi:Tir chaperone protein (CesT) family